MKILMVAIPSSHFFSWSDQLRNSGHEVYWFDITGMSSYAERIDWAAQKINWKMKWDFPGRIFIKRNFPKLYRFQSLFNNHKTEVIFEQYLQEVRPDVVHSFALQLSCLPILNVMNKYKDLKWTLSSWGSDIYYAKEIGIQEGKLTECLRRMDFLITDCSRDYRIAVDKGFTKKYLGVLPGNGGVGFFDDEIIPVRQRKIILIKGYNDEIGRGINIIKAFDKELISLLDKFEVFIFGADEDIKKYVTENEIFKNLKIKVRLKSEFISNNELLRLMGKSYIYIANSLSDGIPNALIEAMGMGAFPIQSNPGNVTEEIIQNGINGFLINNPEDIFEIKNAVMNALKSEKVIAAAFLHNTETVKNKYNRLKVRKEILKVYEEIAD